MRDLNDARVTFVTECLRLGLTLDDANRLWRMLRPPYPA